jgi:hypothetical protein
VAYYDWQYLVRSLSLDLCSPEISEVGGKIADPDTAPEVSSPADLDNPSAGGRAVYSAGKLTVNAQRR